MKSVLIFLLLLSTGLLAQEVEKKNVNLFWINGSFGPSGIGQTKNAGTAGFHLAYQSGKTLFSVRNFFTGYSCGGSPRVEIREWAFMVGLSSCFASFSTGLSHIRGNRRGVVLSSSVSGKLRLKKKK
jgi:hypothetical protein